MAACFKYVCRRIKVNRQTKQVGAILALMAMAFFAGWPFWSWIDKKAASATLQARARALAERNPQLEPAWTVAMLDDVLTEPEAKFIVEASGEKIDADE
jgi:hypothetical protein